jgi:vanillate O-demethylase monooxygenase subunit
MTFLMNYWYGAALSDDVVAEKPFPRLICNQPIVFYRDSSSDVVALEDCCCHRQAPLSLGDVEGDLIRCGYHGWAFDGTGTCVEVPGQEFIPSAARVQRYPVVERSGWIWVWIGDAAKADPAQLPVLPWFEDSSYRQWHLYLHGKAAAQLFIDNMMDISHTGYLHKQTIGTREMTSALEVRRDGTRVCVDRINRNVTPGPAVKRWGGFTGKVDAFNNYYWEPPALCVLNPIRQDSENRLEYHLTNVVTPETETTAHFWFAWASDELMDDPDYPSDSYKAIHHTVMEDLEMVEAQQRIMDLKPNARPIPSTADEPIAAIHRVLDQLSAEQTA